MAVFELILCIIAAVVVSSFAIVAGIGIGLVTGLCCLLWGLA